MKRKTRICLILLIVILLGVFLYSGYRVFSYWSESAKTEACYDALAEKYFSDQNRSIQDRQVDESSVFEDPAVREMAPVQVDFDSLCDVNHDVVGWIYCPDTVINYPVVQGEDNQTYLSCAATGEYNSAGSIFLDYRNTPVFSDRNSVVYGHNRKDGSMFASINQYKDDEYYSAHPIMWLLTPDMDYKIELLAGFITPSDGDVYTISLSEQEAVKLVETAREQSTFYADVSYSGSERLITLSTCSYEYQSARYVLLGKLTPLSN